MPTRRFRACVLLVVIGAKLNFLFASDPRKYVQCKKEVGEDFHVPVYSSPTECEASGPTEGLQCSIGNYKKHFPDACENIQKDLQSRSQKQPPLLSEVCQPLLARINLFTLHCENYKSHLGNPSLNFTFQLPQCDVDSSEAWGKSVKMDFVNTNTPDSYYYQLDICRVFNYTGSNFTSLSYFSKKVPVLITYEWIAIGIRIPTLYRINYALNLTAHPSGIQMNYTVVYKDISRYSMRVVAGAWRSSQIAHFVFMPIEDIVSYLVEASCDQQLWKFSLKVFSDSFEITDIPDSVNIITVTVTPSDEAACNSPDRHCTPINITLPDKNSYNLPRDSKPPPHLPSPTDENENHLVLIVLVCIAVPLIFAIMGAAVFLCLRHRRQSRGVDELPEHPLQPVLCITNLIMSTCTNLKQNLKDYGLEVRLLQHTPDCINEMRDNNIILIIINHDMPNLANWEMFCTLIQLIFENKPLWDRIGVISLNEGRRSQHCLPSAVLRNRISGNYSNELMDNFLDFLDSRTFSLASFKPFFSDLSEACHRGMPVGWPSRSECSGQSLPGEEHIVLLSAEKRHPHVHMKREEVDLMQENESGLQNEMLPSNGRLDPEGSAYFEGRPSSSHSETHPKVPYTTDADETTCKVPFSADSEETSRKFLRATDSDETTCKVPYTADSEEPSKISLFSSHVDESFPTGPHTSFPEATSAAVQFGPHSDEISPDVPSVHRSGVENTDSFPDESTRMLLYSDSKPIANGDLPRSGVVENSYHSPYVRITSLPGDIPHRSGVENTDSFPSESTRMISDMDPKPIAVDNLCRSQVENSYHSPYIRTTTLPSNIPHRSGVENTDSFPSQGTRMLSNTDPKPIADDNLHRNGVENTDSFPSGNNTRSPESYHASVSESSNVMGSPTMLLASGPKPFAGDAAHRNGNENSYSSPQEYPVYGPEEYMFLMSNAGDWQSRDQGMANLNDGHSQYNSAEKGLGSRRTEERDRSAIANNAAPSAPLVSGPEDCYSTPSVSFQNNYLGTESSTMHLSETPLRLPQTHHGISQLQAGAVANGIPPQEKNPDLFSPMFQQSYFNSETLGRELIGRGPESNGENHSQRYDGEWNEGERTFMPEFHNPDINDKDHQSG